MKKEGDRDGQRERLSAAQTLDLRSFGAAFATSRRTRKSRVIKLSLKSYSISNS